MRAAFKTWADEQTDYPREIKKIALAQGIGNQTDEAYSRSDLVEQRRKLMNQWARFLVTSPDDATVVTLRSRRHG
jgi:hypothetical protein